nr:hypothetical protein [Tanacetum cinerariifolium]
GIGACCVVVIVAMVEEVRVDTDDEGNDEENLGLNVGREEGHDEEEEEDELYRDVNINQGRGKRLKKLKTRM